MRSYLVGCALVAGAGLVLSLGVICIRGATASDAWQYLLWRSVAFVAVVAIIATIRHGIDPVTQIRRLGPVARLSALAQVVSQITFVSAMMAGNTAEVFFLMSLTPLIAALLARAVFGEPIGKAGAVAIALALGGVALMSGVLFGEISGGNWTARLLALACAASFAMYSLAMRGSRAEELDAALVLTGCLAVTGSVIALLWQGIALVPRGIDVALALLHGGVVLATGLVLFARGSRRVPVVTLVMLAQAETIAAPIWTWLIFNETTTLPVVLGGLIILAAVVLQAVDGGRRAGAAHARAGNDTDDRPAAQQ